ncbi:GlsB/YeaQ/YmgE family stress response membrane protein [Roseiconus lacunae]|uniref:GlsB/YeaQ/YmgE family stress response membrane protein n=1 Tax=Roseiconus lacunae TaxID=2605694 RepID=A0ABT7PLZ7_9BACT|nr:GlsB/YeaQ/YmgE family stress response membrane protein [Roseiconus lacunae]MCD0458050.1 GlsB/YeaQ/YmgE family stress response membrane protein [Roseiconus lacunae]MDM4017510.1 GlsB/YeaQ/YmgE family stress response membrane protein [Roseiconus lacunae]WRQ48242.1 GlsB/YeaQ/YmgE family stress response membrane protein [Stieleria sp. HD01]
MLIPIIGWMLFGLLIGAVARLLVPGPQPMGLLMTMLLGVAGSFTGGFVAYLIFGGTPFQAVGWIGSLIGAVALLLIAQRTSRRTTV